MRSRGEDIQGRAAQPFRPACTTRFARTVIIGTARLLGVPVAHPDQSARPADRLSTVSGWSRSQRGAPHAQDIHEPTWIGNCAG